VRSQAKVPQLALIEYEDEYEDELLRHRKYDQVA